MSTRTVTLPDIVPSGTEQLSTKKSAELLKFLQGREQGTKDAAGDIVKHDEQIMGVAEVFARNPDGTESLHAKTYTYTSVDAPPKGELVLVQGPALTGDEAKDEKNWDDAAATIALSTEVICRAVLTFDGTVGQWVLGRRVETPITFQGDGQALKGTTPGWEWLQPIVRGADLEVTGRATWFGGPRDNADTGETASGLVNTRRVPDFQGCALPMNGFRNSPRTLGSPLPRFKWGTEVEVECLDEPSKGEKITVKLVDLGPAQFTQKAIDLTEMAFAKFAPPSKGVVNVRFVIRDWMRQLDPKSPPPNIVGTSSEKTAQDGVTTPATIANAGLESLVKSLNLKHVTYAKLVAPISNRQNGVANQLPDAALFGNIVPTLIVLDKLISDLGGPVLHINSSYRSPAYNRAIGGAGLSQHMAFRATDFSLEGVSPSSIATALRQLRGKTFTIPLAFTNGNLSNPAGLNIPLDKTALAIRPGATAGQSVFEFHGGIGEYAKFVHIDCRGRDDEWA